MAAMSPTGKLAALRTRHVTSLGALIVSGLAAGVLGTSSFAQAPTGTEAPARPASSVVPAAEWRTYGADLASTRYLPLDQINAANFNTLEVAWRFKTDNLGPTPEFNFQGTPLMVGGVIYTTAGSRRAVVALDASTGETLWVHRQDEGNGSST